MKVDFQLEKHGFTIIFNRRSQEQLIFDGLNDGLNEFQNKILLLIENNNKITQKELAIKLNTTRRTIERNIAILKEKNALIRCGAKKNGYWKVRK